MPWERRKIADEPKRGGMPFKHGTVSFAGSGADSRSCHIFIALAPGANLRDTLHFGREAHTSTHTHTHPPPPRAAHPPLPTPARPPPVVHSYTHAPPPAR